MKRKIKHIIIHCAATPNGKPFTSADIDNMHKARGFKRDTQWVRVFTPALKHIGYHFVVGLDGMVYTGRHIEEVGAHVQGANSDSIGICMIGTDKFTQAQFDSLKKTVIGLVFEITKRRATDAISADAAFKDFKITVKGHRDYSPDLNGNGIIERNEWLKICPGFSVAEWLSAGMVAPKGALL